jgi:uncharacterized protein YxeA
MKNKKALENSIWLVGMAVILVVITVIVTIFYDIETGNFSAFIRKITKSENTKDITTQCNSLVERNAQYEYCCAKKQIIYKQEDETKREELTCSQLSTKPIGTNIQKINCNKDIC